jgi:PspAA-like protein
VIVRISGEGQYRIDDGEHGRLNELDDALVAAVEGGDEDGFHAAFEELLAFVRAQGTSLGDDELEASDVILPPADTSFVEAGAEFTGEGLIPDPA